MAAASPAGLNAEPGRKNTVTIPAALDVALAKNDVRSTVVAEVPKPTLGAASATVRVALAPL